MMNIMKLKKNTLSNNVKKLESKIDSIESYLPIYKDKLANRSNRKIERLLARDKDNLKKLEVHFNLKELFGKEKNNELYKLDDWLYCELRKSEQKFKKKEDETLEKEAIKEIFANYEIKETELQEKFNNERYNEYHKKSLETFNKISSEYDLEESKEIKQLQNIIDVKEKELLAVCEAKNDEKYQKRVKASKEKVVKLKDKLKLKKEQLKVYNTEEEQKLRDLVNSLPEEEQSKYDQLLSLYNDDNNDHLVLKDLSMHFGGLKAVDQLSFNVKRNEIFGLIGPNGAGKTTVFNCITQFYKPTSGYIYFKNKEKEILRLTDYKVHDVIKEGIVRTFQNVELILELSVLDNLLVGAHTAYKTNVIEHILHLPTLKREEEIIHAKALQILTDLNLLDYKDSYPVGLPYGVLKRIELARTLMLNPELIILDEPAAGLNESETMELAQIIKDIRDIYQVTIFLVEHDMGLVMDVCDRICAISFGKLLAIGTPHEIQNDPVVQEAYLGAK